MEEEPKISTTEKVKNPKRVEQGKRLAAISKEAKARKAAERKKMEEECTENANLLYVSVGTLGVVGLGYGAYRFFCKGEEEPQQQGEQPQKEKQPEKKNFDDL